MLEEKIETLTKEVVALRKVIETAGLGGAAKAGAAKAKPAADEDDEKPAAKKAPAKKKVVEPDHDADETGTAMRKAAKLDKPAVQKYIKKAGCADLAELLTKPELFDAAFEFADGILNAEDELQDDDDV